MITFFRYCAIMPRNFVEIPIWRNEIRFCYLTSDIQAVVFSECLKYSWVKSSRDHTPCQVKTTHISKNKVSAWSKNLRWDSLVSYNQTMSNVKEVAIKSNPNREAKEKVLIRYTILQNCNHDFLFLSLPNSMQKLDKYIMVTYIRITYVSVQVCTTG